MSGWVGGWVVEKIEEEQAVLMSCCTSRMGGWVGGWVDQGGRIKVGVVLLVAPLAAAQTRHGAGRVGGWVGGWVGGSKVGGWVS